jgi:hypothetical protein
VLTISISASARFPPPPCSSQVRRSSNPGAPPLLSSMLRLILSASVLQAGSAAVESRSDQLDHAMAAAVAASPATAPGRGCISEAVLLAPGRGHDGPSTPTLATRIFPRRRWRYFPHPDSDRAALPHPDGRLNQLHLPRTRGDETVIVPNSTHLHIEQIHNR